jgi:hypothetical protein
MAHQVPDNLALELPCKVILRRPELAKLMSVVASECAGLEADLTWLYATLLGKYLPHNQRNGPPIHPIGFQIFNAVESTNKRLQLIESLAGTLGHKDTTT